MIVHCKVQIFRLKQGKTSKQVMAKGSVFSRDGSTKALVPSWWKTSGCAGAWRAECGPGRAGHGEVLLGRENISASAWTSLDILMLCTDQGIMFTEPCETAGKRQFAPKLQPQHPDEQEYVEMVLGKQQTLPDPRG